MKNVTVHPLQSKILNINISINYGNVLNRDWRLSKIIEKTTRKSSVEKVLNSSL